MTECDCVPGTICKSIITLLIWFEFYSFLLLLITYFYGKTCLIQTDVCLIQTDVHQDVSEHLLISISDSHSLEPTQRKLWKRFHRDGKNPTVSQNQNITSAHWWNTAATVLLLLCNQKVEGKNGEATAVSWLILANKILHSINQPSDTIGIN